MLRVVNLSRQTCRRTTHNEKCFCCFQSQLVEDLLDTAVSRYYVYNVVQANVVIQRITLFIENAGNHRIL